MFELIMLTIALMIISLLTIESVRSKIKLRRISVALLQSEINRDAIEKKLLEVLASKDSSSIEQTDGFLKFVSESRDAAFKYIEVVQESLKPLEEAIGLLGSSQIKSADRKRAIEIIESAIKNLPDDL
jgi:uncharacterized membrane protein